MRPNDRSNERLAPVSYLPWADPDAESPGSPDGSPDGDTPPARDALAAENLLTRKLRARSLSVAEAEDVLAEAEALPDESAELIERFVRVGYLDDRQLAEQIVRTHHERKGLGRNAVQAEMRRRRLDESAIAEALDELGVDETAPATALAEKRLRTMGSLDDQTAERRLLGFLLRKGYSSGVARDAVRAAFTEAGRRAR